MGLFFSNPSHGHEQCVHQTCEDNEAISSLVVERCNDQANREDNFLQRSGKSWASVKDQTCTWRIVCARTVASVSQQYRRGTAVVLCSITPVRYRSGLVRTSERRAKAT